MSLYIVDIHGELEGDYEIIKKYEEPTTKNDSRFDWESYKDVDGNCLDDLILEVLQNNFDCGNTYGYKVADEIIGLLPSMTPQEPKTGHWIFVGEENEEETKAGNFRYVCSECGFTDVHGKSTYVPYCWQCGAKMAESEADSGNDDN